MDTVERAALNQALVAKLAAMTLAEAKIALGGLGIPPPEELPKDKHQEAYAPIITSATEQQVARLARLLSISVPSASGQSPGTFLGGETASHPVSPSGVPNKFEVNARLLWQDTGIDVLAGHTVAIRQLSGTWNCNDLNGHCDADGYPNVIAGSAYVLPGVNEGALVGRLGGEGQPFFVGRNWSREVEHSARLFLIANDDIGAKHGAGFSDNNGSIVVEITLVANDALAADSEAVAGRDHFSKPSDAPQEKAHAVTPGKATGQFTLFVNGSSQPDRVPLHTDERAKVDLLDRRAFALALATRIRHIHSQNLQSARDESFLLHIHGPWGVGKTSLLGFLKEEFRGAGFSSNELPWVVIEFDAWQHQELNAPWWSLMNTVFKQSLKQLGWRRRAWVFIREYLWRFSTGWALVVFGFAAICWLITVGLKFVSNWSEDVKTVSVIISGLVTLWGLVLSATRTMMPGSAKAAEAFMLVNQSPTQHLSKHFRKLVRLIKSPVAILIDDLDRCNEVFVVRLLESIQTLFRGAPVTFVVAADRRWICRSFESVYKTFGEAIQEPGRPLGYLFLEKFFQLSVTVPCLSSSTQLSYWRQLIQTGELQSKGRNRGLERRAEQELAAIGTEESILQELEKHMDSSDESQAFRRAAIARLVSPKVQAKTEHALLPFAPLLEANPRAMKRFVNAYGIQRAVAILVGVQIGVAELALWTIVSLRWPVLAQHLEEFPDDVRKFDDQPPDKIGDDLRALFGNRAVQDVIKWTPEGSNEPVLDPEKLRTIIKLAPSESNTPSIA